MATTGSAPTTDGIGSLEQTDGIPPWDYYERLRERGDVVWDETLQAWLVSSYELVMEVARKDEELFERNYVPREGRSQLGMTPEEWVWFMSGGSTKAGLSMQTGSDHEHKHRWFMQSFSPRVLKQWRETLFRPICEQEIARFAGAGRAELAGDYAAKVTPRVMAGMLGLPHDDEEWLDHVVGLFGARLALKQRHSFDAAADPEVKERAFAAVRELHEKLRPYVLERRDGTGDDFISIIWRSAPDLFRDDSWDETDVLAVAVSAYASGAGSIARSVVNMLYLALTSPLELRDRLRSDEQALKAFVEESLRLYGPVSWSPRYAKADVELGGAQIRNGDLVLALSLSAQHDPVRYPDPYAVDLERQSPRNHFSFFAGPRTCPGQGLARTELDIILLTLLERLPDVRLDPDAPPPVYAGLLTRSWEPLEVVFSVPA
jgi:cytochrome P450